MLLEFMGKLSKPTLSFSQALPNEQIVAAATGGSRTFAIAVLVLGCAVLVLALVVVFALPRKPGRERQRKKAIWSLPLITALLVIAIIRVSTG
jgi:NADH:ubiquinone oxidoreductase subunit 6 (subunit J)